MGRLSNSESFDSTDSGTSAGSLGLFSRTKEAQRREEEEEEEAEGEEEEGTQAPGKRGLGTPCFQHLRSNGICA